MYTALSTLGSRAVSAEALVRETRCSLRSVWRGLRDLEDRGLLVRERQHDALGLKRSNRYRLEVGRRTTSRPPVPRPLEPARPPSSPVASSPSVVGSEPGPAPALLLDERLVLWCLARLQSASGGSPVAWWERAARGESSVVDAFHQVLVSPGTPYHGDTDRKTIKATLIEAARRHRRAAELEAVGRALVAEGQGVGAHLVYLADLVDRARVSKQELLALYRSELLHLQGAEGPQLLDPAKLEASRLEHRRRTLVFLRV